MDTWWKKMGLKVILYWELQLKIHVLYIIHANMKTMELPRQDSKLGAPEIPNTPARLELGFENVG